LTRLIALGDGAAVVGKSSVRAALPGAVSVAEIGATAVAALAWRRLSSGI
jgi:hypothetical protein